MRVRFSRAALLFLCVILGWQHPAITKQKHRAPLPDTVLKAKTVYLDNRSGYADFKDKAYDEL
jgi:hypothetical protein